MTKTNKKVSGKAMHWWVKHLVKTNNHKKIIAWIARHHQESDLLNAKDEHGRSLLQWAIEAGYVDIVDELLQHPGIEVNQIINETPLLFTALEKNNVLLFHRLVTYPDTDLNIRDTYDNLLTEACRLDRPEQLALLLTHLENRINECDLKGRTPLNKAVMYGHIKCLEVLLEYDNLDINAQDAMGYTALMVAVTQYRNQAIDLLISHPKINFELRNNEGNNVLMLALSLSYDKKSVALALSSKCRLDFIPNLKRETVLTLAATNGHLELVNKLLNHPYHIPRATDKHIINSLMGALKAGKVDVVKLFIRKGLSTQIDIMSWAMEYVFLDVIEELLSKSVVQVNARDSLGNTPLILVLEHEQPDLALTLLSFTETDAAAANNQGDTALFIAAAKGFAMIVERLLGGVDVNARDKSGNTALNLAVQHGQRDVVQLLLNYETTNINTANAQGRTPLISAVLTQDTELMHMILKHPQVECALQDNEARTALIHATALGLTDMVMLLLEKDDQCINIQDINGDTALTVAVAEYDETPVIRHLILHHANPNLKNRRGYSAYLRSQDSNTHGISYLLEHPNARVTSFYVAPDNSLSDSPENKPKRALSLFSPKAKDELLLDDLQTSRRLSL